MLKKNLAVGITLLFIFSSTVPTISGFDYWLQDENRILNLSECKDIIRSYDVHIFCIGRIDNLSINETSYAFDCINVRMILRYYYDGPLMYYYLHLKKSNIINSWVNGKSWEFSYTHYYNRDFHRFSIENCTFSGILKPSYIIGVFYLSMGNNSSFCDNELLESHPFHVINDVAFPSRGIKRLVGVLCLQSMRFIPDLKVWVFSLGFHNNKIKCEDESLILQDSFVSINFFIGAISDLEVGEDYYSFNATNVFRTYYYKWSNIRWMSGVQRIRNIKYNFGFGGDIQFRGILTSSSICGFFYH